METYTEQQKQVICKLSEHEDQIVNCAIKLRQLYYENERYFDKLNSPVMDNLDNPTFSHGTQGELSVCYYIRKDIFDSYLADTEKEYNMYKDYADNQGYGMGAAQRGFDVTRPLGIVWTTCCKVLREINAIKDIIGKL